MTVVRRKDSRPTMTTLVARREMVSATMLFMSPPSGALAGKAYGSASQSSRLPRRYGIQRNTMGMTVCFASD